MYQPDRGDYRNQPSALNRFSHTCLGKVVVMAVTFLLLLLIAHLTRPDEQTMREEMTDNVRQWIESTDSINTDWMDDAVTNLHYAFTHAEGEPNEEQMKNFKEHNALTPHIHAFFSTMHIYNSFRTESERCGIGLFGMVIPTVNFNDFMLHDAPMRGNYNEPLVEPSAPDEYLGENPGLEPFRYKGE